MRFRADPEGRLIGDGSGKSEGRGAYLCPEVACLETAVKKGAFARTLRVKGLKLEKEELIPLIEGFRNHQKGESGESVHGENLSR